MFLMYEHRCFYKICDEPPVILIRTIPPDDTAREMLLCAKHRDFVYDNSTGCRIEILSKYTSVNNDG